MTTGLTQRAVSASGRARHCYRDPLTGKQVPYHLVMIAARLSDALRKHINDARAALAALGLSDDADRVVALAIARLSTNPAPRGGAHRRRNDVSADVARDLESLGITPPQPGGKGEKAK